LLGEAEAEGWAVAVAAGALQAVLDASPNVDAAGGMLPVITTR
jgi:hypothetical protein